ncbi:EamA family transporter [Vibrio sp. Isolate24]|uniref:EamA family transporter n=1 Tax=Vibrio sp. Isolate24 TaxID=2908534 RepID=UPI001EFE8949|nr:EamA family transporter [Vibrio sp. Isolate24]MCG9679275.1 hypothetical protein [Vibrio sp. Isolate24]
MQQYFFIFSTLAFSVYSQTVIKWKSQLLINMPSDTFGKVVHMFWVLLNPWVISSIVATFFAGISWMMVMSKFDIGFAYPFMSLNIIIMMWVGFVVFNEPIDIYRILGTALICLGLIVIYKGE